MNSHLSIKINGKHLALPDDFSMDIDYKNPMLNDSESYSYPLEMPLDGNRFLMGNIEDKKSPQRPVDLENTKARIYADGLPIFDGKLKTSDDEELTDSLSMNIEGGQTLDDLISDLDCRDIPIKDDILIGEKIGHITVDMTGDYQLKVEDSNPSVFEMGKRNGTVDITPQALGFSVPYRCTEQIDGIATKKSSVIVSGIGIANEDGEIEVGEYEHITPKKYGETSTNPGETYINVTDPYPYKEYCNARVSYKHYKLAADGTTDSDNTESNPYMVLDAERPQSGICFYVQYFLDCLFYYLGLEWDNSALKDIEDFNRLCFYTTKCGYNEKEIIKDREYTDFSYINQWLKSRGCGAQLSIDEGDWGKISGARIPNGTAFNDRKIGYAVLDDDIFEKNGVVTGKSYDGVKLYFPGGSSLKPNVTPIDDTHGYFWWHGVTVSSLMKNIVINKVTASYCQMYANSDNWPDTSVSTIISSLENQFGIRFIYDAEEKKVTAKLLRDMYRGQSSPRSFRGTIHEMNKVSEKISGVRMCYSAESDSKEQQNNLRDSVRDYDTNYDYVDYPDPDKQVGQVGTSKARTTVTSKTYKDFCNNAGITDNICYIDKQTGNAYRVKIDSEATKESEAKPAWFEVGQFKGVEMGDCSAENEDFVTELTSDFEPLVLSDANSMAVRMACASGNAQAIALEQNQPLLVAFCDEDMEHEYVEQRLDYAISVTDTSTGETVSGLDAAVRTTLNLLENYDPTGSDDGNSPLQSYDWGLAVAIMRGGGTSSTTYSYDANYDTFGNSKWGQTVGDYALTVDSLDQLGNRYDYNGDKAGVMKGERFSLKLRAFKGELTTWADRKNKDGSYEFGSSSLCNADTYSDTDGWYYIKNRGTFDRFMYEHAYFLLYRRKFIIRCDITAAFLMDIRNHWYDRWNINGETGYINKVSTSITAKDGIGETEIEFYAI